MWLWQWPDDECWNTPGSDRTAPDGTLGHHVTFSDHASSSYIGTKGPRARFKPSAEHRFNFGEVAEDFPRAPSYIRTTKNIVKHDFPVYASLGLTG